MKKVFIFSAAALYSSQLFALGGGGFGYRDGMFWGNDLDRNEYLDIQEAQGIYNLGDPTVFAKFDKNDDGKLIKFEFYDYLAQRSNNE
ncbi:MAG: hypothetical protein AAGB35_08375 [Pseudomonadota bacterium]